MCIGEKKNNIGYILWNTDIYCATFGTKYLITRKVYINYKYDHCLLNWRLLPASESMSSQICWTFYNQLNHYAK